MGWAHKLVAESFSAKLVIDTDKRPKIPSGWRIVAHKGMGLVTWNPANVQFYVSPEQTFNGVKGGVLRRKLQDLPTLNATALDALLEHLTYIPDTFKNNYIAFWKTIYADQRGFQYVRCLTWVCGHWNGDCYIRVRSIWTKEYAAILLFVDNSAQ